MRRGRRLYKEKEGYVKRKKLCKEKVSYEKRKKAI